MSGNESSTIFLESTYRVVNTYENFYVQIHSQVDFPGWVTIETWRDGEMTGSVEVPPDMVLKFRDSIVKYFEDNYPF